jgi:hypothetical protein
MSMRNPSKYGKIQCMDPIYRSDGLDCYTSVCLRQTHLNYFDLPDMNDVPGLLAIVCRGSPKLRATLRIVAELVILHRGPPTPS